MRFDSIEDLYGAITQGMVGRGDVICVSQRVYGAMSQRQKAALWDRALRTRAVLLTDLPAADGIEVRHPGSRE